MGLLRKIRSQLGFELEEVAAAAGWPRAHLRDLEATDDLDTEEAERLSDLYGVAVDQLLAGGEPKAPPVAVLLRAQADALDADSRFKIAECVTVARHARELEQLLGSSDFKRSLARFRASADYSHPSKGTPERLASAARESLELGDAPVRSISTQILRRLSILSIWVRLPSWIDALSFENADTGPVIISNTDGEHMGTAFGRRVSWAHELCHLFHDRPKLQKLRGFCVMAQHGREHASRAYQIERRARAFAAYFLAPRRAFEATWAAGEGVELDARARRAMETFGIGYEATRSHLKNLELLDMRVELARVPVSAPASWDQADPGPDVDPLAAAAGLPPQRGGALFLLVIEALSKGLISESAARETLRLPMSAWLRLAPQLEREGRYQPGRLYTTSASVLA